MCGPVVFFWVSMPYGKFIFLRNVNTRLKHGVDTRKEATKTKTVVKA
jgi:hypothetical protein